MLRLGDVQIREHTRDEWLSSPEDPGQNVSRLSVFITPMDNLLFSGRIISRSDHIGSHQTSRAIAMIDSAFVLDAAHSALNHTCNFSI
jgi:hypothetical protein